MIKTCYRYSQKEKKRKKNRHDGDTYLHTFIHTHIHTHMYQKTSSFFLSLSCLKREKIEKRENENYSCSGTKLYPKLKTKKNKNRKNSPEKEKEREFGGIHSYSFDSVVHQTCQDDTFLKWSIINASNVGCWIYLYA